MTVIAACIFTGNWAVKSGGAVFEDSDSISITYINSLFDSNKTTVSTSGEGGGAIFSQGGAGANSINCTFVKNLAIGGEGGGIRIKTLKNPNLTNCIFWDNGDGANGGTQDESAQIHLGTNAVPVVKNCTIEGCLSTGFCPSGSTNKPTEPIFVNAMGGDYQLQAIPANDDLIDGGDGENAMGSACPSTNTTTVDLAGNTRFIEDDGMCGINTAVVIDIGAYEVQIP